MKNEVMNFKFDETLLSKWDQRNGHAPPPYTGAMARLLKGINIGDAYVDSLPMSMVICHGGKTKEEIVLQPHPDWVDWDSVERGQECFRQHLGQSYVGLSMILLQGFSIGRFADVLVSNGYAQNAETAFERYRETSFAILDWMRYPLREFGSKGQRQIMNVRAMHSFSRRKSKNLLGEDAESVGQALSQFDMAEVLLGFAGVLPVVLEQDLKMEFTRQERIDLCHCWRLIGYHLGLMDEFNVCNSLEDMEDMVLEFMQFTPVRWRTCRPSTFELQRTAIDGFGSFTGLGAEFYMGMMKFSCNSRSWGVDYLERDCLPGMDIVGGQILKCIGNDRVGAFLNWQIAFMRDKWAEDAPKQRRMMKIMANGAYWMDLVVWRLAGLVALQLQSYIKRLLIGFLLGFASTRLVAKKLLGK